MNNPIDAYDISIDDLDSIEFFEHFDVPSQSFLTTQKLLTSTTTPKEATMKARTALEILNRASDSWLTSASHALGPI